MRFTIRRIGLSDSYLLLCDGRAAASAHPERTPSGSKWWWSVSATGVRVFPPDIVRNGLADSLDEAVAEFAVAWQQLLAADVVIP
jgi:hypothetical protein